MMLISTFCLLLFLLSILLSLTLLFLKLKLIFFFFFLLVFFFCFLFVIFLCICCVFDFYLFFHLFWFQWLFCINFFFFFSTWFFFATSVAAFSLVFSVSSSRYSSSVPFWFSFFGSNYISAAISYFNFNDSSVLTSFIFSFDSSFCTLVSRDENVFETTRFSSWSWGLFCTVLTWIFLQVSQSYLFIIAVCFVQNTGEFFSVVTLAYFLNGVVIV